MFNEFITELIEKEIQISFSNGKLQYSGPKEYIDEELIEKLKKYKAKLFKYYWPFDCHNMMPINTEGSRIPFTLLHAGKAVYPLNEYFGREQPFYGFFDEGSDGKQIRYKSVKTFATEYRKQIQKIIPEGPYILGGFSFGGILAYEIAIQMQEEGHDVPFVVLGDCEIPKYYYKTDKSPVYIKILKRIYHAIQNIYYGIYHSLKNIFYDFLILLKKDIPANLRKPYIIWTYFNLMRKYNPKTRLNGEILLFRSEENDSHNELLGWEKLCDRVQLVNVKGNHQSLYDGTDTINTLKVKIGEMLEKANSIFAAKQS